MTVTSTIDALSPLHTREAGRGTNPLRPVPTGTAVVARERRESRPGQSAEHAAPRKASLSPAAALRNAQMPAFAPLLEEFEIAGWSSHRRLLGGNFHDWLLLDGRELLVIVGQVVGPQPVDPMESALVAQAAWAAIRAHACHVCDAGTLLSLATRNLWPMPSANLHAAVAVALIDTVEGHATLANAGDCLIWKVRAAATEKLAARQPLLGEVADFTYISQWVQLSLRERLLLVADDAQRRSLKLATSVAASFAQLDAESHRRMLATDAVALVRRHYERNEDDSRSPASIIAVRRR